MLTYQIQGGDIDAAAAQQRLVLKGRESMTMQQLPRAMKTIGDLDVAASLRVHAPTHNLVIVFYPSLPATNGRATKQRHPDLR